MKMKVIFSMDVEPDISLYLKDSYLGIEKALPMFLDTASEHGIRVDFFLTGNVCERYPALVARIKDEGHGIGSHGLNHNERFFCRKSYEWQYDNISKATGITERISGLRPTMFRAPNFSANGDTIRALEAQGYSIDSSVLPGRMAKRLKILKVLDFRRAPRVPYSPSGDSISERGCSRILEVPITENPFQRGSPVGTGYLNIEGADRTVEALRRGGSDYAMFLIHPWECVNLGEHHSNLPQWVKSICRENGEDISLLIKSLKKNGFAFQGLESFLVH